MKTLLYLALSCLMIFCNACSTHHENFDGPPKSPLPVLGRFVEQYGALTSPLLDDYLQGRVSVLAGFIPMNTPIQFRVTLLNTSQPVAFTPGGGYIIISKGVFAHLKHESELMFLLAHEMGHEVLEHTKSQNLYGTDPQAREALELQADQFASMLLMHAGFDPSYGLKALDDAHQGFLEEQYSSVYPTLEKRRAALSQILANLPFQVYAEEDNANLQKDQAVSLGVLIYTFILADDLRRAPIFPPDSECQK